MTPHIELANLLVKDLINGVFIPKKDQYGSWYSEAIPYQNLLKSYCVNIVPRSCFLSTYKTIPPLDTCDHETKTEWKKFVNEIFPATTPEFRLEAVKIIYTVAALSENEQSNENRPPAC